MKIGEIMASDREITLNEGKKTVTVMVANKGDRPVQVGSHFHFFEVNRRKKRCSSSRWAAENASSV